MVYSWWREADAVVRTTAEFLDACCAPFMTLFFYATSDMHFFPLHYIDREIMFVCNVGKRVAAMRVSSRLRAFKNFTLYSTSQAGSAPPLFLHCVSLLVSWITRTVPSEPLFLPSANLRLPPLLPAPWQSPSPILSHASSILFGSFVPSTSVFKSVFAEANIL